MYKKYFLGLNFVKIYDNRIILEMENQGIIGFIPVFENEKDAKIHCTEYKECEIEKTTS